MEVTGIAALGIYLMLAFVLPGFCYAFVFGLCFPDEIANLLKALNQRREAFSPEASNSTKQEGIARALSFLTILAITGGLLLSSVCFVVENVSRYVAPCYMERLFPNIGIEKISGIEVAGKGIFLLQVLSGEAIMHFNIGLGILLLVLAYLFTGRRRRVLLVICLVITALANLVDAHTLYVRAGKAVTEAVDQLHRSSAAIPSGASALPQSKSPIQVSETPLRPIVLHTPPVAGRDNPVSNLRVAITADFTTMPEHACRRNAAVSKNTALTIATPMKKIPLSQGLFAKVDDEDFDWLSSESIRILSGGS